MAKKIDPQKLLEVLTALGPDVLALFQRFVNLFSKKSAMASCPNECCCECVNETIEHLVQALAHQCHLLRACKPCDPCDE